MLAAVEDEQPGAVPEMVQHRGGQVAPWLLDDAEGRRDRLEDEVGVDDGPELDQPRPLVVVVEVIGRQAEAQPRLADAARSDEGQERRDAQDRPGVGELAVAPDEARQLARQVAGATARGPERPEFADEPVGGDLVQPLEPDEVLEPVLAEVDQGDVRGQVAADEVVAHLGDEDLTAMAGRADPGGHVDVDPDVALVGADRLAGVEAHPDLHPDVARPAARPRPGVAPRPPRAAPSGRSGR